MPIEGDVSVKRSKKRVKAATTTAAATQKRVPIKTWKLFLLGWAVMVIIAAPCLVMGLALPGDTGLTLAFVTSLVLCIPVGGYAYIRWHGALAVAALLGCAMGMAGVSGREVRTISGPVLVDVDVSQPPTRTDHGGATFVDAHVESTLWGGTSHFVTTRNAAGGPMRTEISTVVAPVVSSSWSSADPVRVFAVCNGESKAGCRRRWRQPLKAGVFLDNDNLGSCRMAAQRAATKHGLEIGEPLRCIRWVSSPEAEARRKRIMMIAMVAMMGLFWSVGITIYGLARKKK